MPVKEIKTICFVGAGTMGCVNALVAAVSGYDCILYDTSENALQSASQRLAVFAPLYAAPGIIDPENISDALKRIRFLSDPVAATRDVDLLSESVPENIVLKRKVHRTFDKLCPQHTIFSTNTSILLVSELEDAVTRRDRFAALHFNPGSKLVDVVGGPCTTTEALDVLCRFAKSLSLVPIKMRKENRGYIANYLFGALYESAMLLHKEWDQSIEDIDSAWMIGRGAMLGPFGVLDFVGLNVIFDGSNMNAEWNQEKKEISLLFLDALRPYIDRGDLGIKTGQGFYAYPETAFFQPGFLDNRHRAQELYEVMLCNLVSAAILLVMKEYASFEHVDRVWMIAQNQAMGPFGMLDEIGLDTYLKILQKDIPMTRYHKENTGRIGEFLRTYVEHGDLGVSSGGGFYSYPEPLYTQEGFLHDCTGTDEIGNDNNIQ
jgi:3-hydroxybutyryl-CoA dehydrogenase